jgi:hypothetical protein
VSDPLSFALSTDFSRQGAKSAKIAKKTVVIHCQGFFGVRGIFAGRCRKPVSIFVLAKTPRQRQVTSVFVFLSVLGVLGVFARTGFSLSFMFINNWVISA